MDSESKTGYEPDRIPPSVFLTTTTTATQDWSAASNESLFSIHIGNNSFTRDHVLLMLKSGDLSNLDQQKGNCVSDNIQNDVTNATANNGEETKSLGITESKTEDQDRSTKPKPESSGENQHSPSMSCRSDTSYNSSNSFAFPVFQGDLEGKNTPINPKIETRKMEVSSHGRGQAQELQPQNSKSGGGGGGWFSCFYCFSQKH